MDFQDLDRAIGELIRIQIERAGRERAVPVKGDDSTPSPRRR